MSLEATYREWLNYQGRQIAQIHPDYKHTQPQLGEDESLAKPMLNHALALVTELERVVLDLARRIDQLTATQGQ